MLKRKFSSPSSVITISYEDESEEAKQCLVIKLFFLLFALQGSWKRGGGGWGLKFGLAPGGYVSVSAWHRVLQRLVPLRDRHRDEVLPTLGR